MTISTEILRYRPEKECFEATLLDLRLLEPPTSFLLVNPKTGAKQTMTCNLIIYEGNTIKGWKYTGGDYVALVHTSNDEVK
jgi:hypothetical protein